MRNSAAAFALTATPVPTATHAPAAPGPELPSHLPDFGFPGAFDYLSSHLSVVATLFISAYLLIGLLRLMTGDEVEFLGMFRTSRRLAGTRKALAEMTLLLRGRSILFKCIASSLRRADSIVTGNTTTTKPEALKYLCEWFPQGLTFGRTAEI
jgi:hypothetical protein